MKELLALIAVLLSGVVAEAPYPPSGFRPSGPAFELPQKNQQEYLPPVDPRRPLNPNVEYGTPEEDVSVQGLPAQEQVPIFQYQLQQEKYREFERQRQLEAAQARSRANQFPNPQVPRQFVPQPTQPTTPSTTESTFSTRNPDDFRTTTEPLDLNEGETLDDNKSDSENKAKVTVEVSRQNLQEYPGELFLSSLAQLQYQPQFVPLQQFGQIRAPIYFQPVQEQSQKQVAGYDAQTHFAALPSVLAQRQQLNQQFPQNPAFLVAQEPANGFIQPQPQYQPAINNQYQPLVQPQVQAFPQPVVQTQAYQPNQFAPRQPEANEDARNQQEQQDQPQYVYQQSYQPQEVIYQPAQPQINQYQAPEQSYFVPQAQLVNYPNQITQQYQNGFVPQQFLSQQVFQNQQQVQGQDAFLQSGLDANQQGNGINQGRNEEKDDNPDDESEQDDGSATAVATAFGARTQPRVFTRYGAPVPVPRVAALPQTTTESSAQNEQATEDTGAVAEANAFSSRRKNAKLRSRRVRPVFTLDRSGHLVLAQDQN